MLEEREGVERVSPPQEERSGNQMKAGWGGQLLRLLAGLRVSLAAGLLLALASPACLVALSSVPQGRGIAATFSFRYLPSDNGDCWRISERNCEIGGEITELALGVAILEHCTWESRIEDGERYYAFDANSTFLDEEDFQLSKRSSLPPGAFLLPRAGGREVEVGIYAAGWPFRSFSGAVEDPFGQPTGHWLWGDLLDSGFFHSADRIAAPLPLPLRPIGTGLALNTVIFALCVQIPISTTKALLKARARWRRVRERCEGCGHPIVASQTRCPECGRKL